MAASFTLRVAKAYANAFAVEHNIVFSANYRASGTVPEIDGVSLGYSTAETPDGQVAITFAVLKKPFYVSLDMIENHVKALISGN